MTLDELFAVFHPIWVARSRTDPTSEILRSLELFREGSKCLLTDEKKQKLKKYFEVVIRKASHQADDFILLLDITCREYRSGKEVHCNLATIGEGVRCEVEDRCPHGQADMGVYCEAVVKECIRLFSFPNIP